MQRVRIIAVGALSEKYYKEAHSEYLKRLSRYLDFSVTELADEPLPKNASPAQTAQATGREGERILAALKKGERAVVLDLGGRALTSPGLAARITAWEDRPTALIIGGSCGLSHDVLARADESIKLSELTFTHNMARLILMEQLYRGCKINNNETYHK